MLLLGAGVWHTLVCKYQLLTVLERMGAVRACVLKAEGQAWEERDTSDAVGEVASGTEA